MRRSEPIGAISLEKLEKITKQSKKQVQNLTESYEISIVTHMFGGSHKEGQVDAVHPVRASSIRGQLRFWWRATRGTQYTDVKSLREAETAIFGNTKNPSKVKIWVGETSKPRLELILQKNHRNRLALCRKLSSYQYVLFPYEIRREEQHDNEKKKKLYYLNTEIPYTFFLHLNYSNAEMKKELHAALWAWINFGGLGARTRRGCGSLFCKSFSPSTGTVRNSRDLSHWMNQYIKTFEINIDSDVNREWPTLQRMYIKYEESQDRSLSFRPPLQAWKEVVHSYKCFRRQSNDSRGRSHWPEADSIRHMTNNQFGKHRQSVTIEKSNDNIAFPRAQFGLPIHFRFKDSRDPVGTILKPKDKDRLSSRVIIKAIATSQRTALPAAIIMNQPILEDAELVVADSKNTEITKKLSQYQLSYQNIYPKLSYGNSPMKGTTSAIDAWVHKEGKGSSWKQILPEKP